MPSLVAYSTCFPVVVSMDATVVLQKYAEVASQLIEKKTVNRHQHIVSLKMQLKDITSRIMKKQQENKPVIQ